MWVSFINLLFFNNFRFLGETNPESLDLEACFNYWSSRLRGHKVTEVRNLDVKQLESHFTNCSQVVGCSNEDFVVTGFAKLLTRCVSLARSRGIVVRNEYVPQITRIYIYLVLRDRKCGGGNFSKLAFSPNFRVLRKFRTYRTLALSPWADPLGDI